jgi:hypothetical protein
MRGWGRGLKKFKIQMARSKWQMGNHLKFALAARDRLPFDLLVFKTPFGNWLDMRGMKNLQLPPAPSP